MRNLDISKTAHLCIDLERAHIGTRHKALAEKVSGEMAPFFLQQGIPTYWAYYDRGVGAMGAGVHGYKKQPGYFEAPKTNDCAFRGATYNFDADLKRQGIDKLLISGLRSYDCVFESAMEALRRGFKVVLITNGTNFSDLPEDKRLSLLNEGAEFKTFEEVKMLLHPESEPVPSP